MFSIWNSGRRGEDYNYIDKVISEYFWVSGTAAYIHLYDGVYDQNGKPFNISTSNTASNITSIQDVLFLENRDRKYNPTVYELRTIYNVGDSDFDLRQFGMFITNDTYFLEVHFNDMIGLLGRKLMNGDVIELPHQRDEFLLNGAGAINKFYVVEDANRASDGYSATWFSHIWRVKVSPMPAGQEFNDILNQQMVNPLGLPMTNADGTPSILGGMLTTMATDLGLNQAVVDSAKANFTKRYFETQQFWIAPGEGSELGNENPWIFTGDGIPPNGAVPIGQGTSFPTDKQQDDYYLRTDYKPPVLFMFDNNKWRRQEVNWRGTSWNIASRLLQDFIGINDTETATFEDGTSAPVKTNLSKAITKPGIDF